MNTSVKEVDTPETLLPLNWICANAMLKCFVQCHLDGLVHDIVLIRLDVNAEVDIDSREDILDSDDGVPRGESSIWSSNDQPGETTDTKIEGGQWRVRGGLGENGRWQLWADLGVKITHVVFQVWCCKICMGVQAVRKGRRRYEWESVRLGDRGRGVDTGLWRGGIR
jgi:hypothetical protein